MKIRKTIIIVLLCFGLVGCSDAQIADFVAYVQLWAIANGYTTKDGELDGPRLMTVLLSGGNVDPGESAVLNQASNVNRIKIANQLAKEGFQESNPEKLEEAMRQRPQEYGFQAQYAVVRYTDISQFNKDLSPYDETNKEHFISSSVFVESLSEKHMDAYPKDILREMENNAGKKSAEERIRAHQLVINSAALKFEQFQNVLEPSKESDPIEKYRLYLASLEETVRYNYTVYQSLLAISNLSSQANDRERANRSREIYMESYQALRRGLSQYYQGLQNPA